MDSGLGMGELEESVIEVNKRERLVTVFFDKIAWESQKAKSKAQKRPSEITKKLLRATLGSTPDLGLRLPSPTPVCVANIYLA